MKAFKLIFMFTFFISPLITINAKINKQKTVYLKTKIINKKETIDKETYAAIKKLKRPFFDLLVLTPSTKQEQLINALGNLKRALNNFEKQYMAKVKIAKKAIIPAKSKIAIDEKELIKSENCMVESVVGGLFVEGQIASIKQNPPPIKKL